MRFWRRRKKTRLQDVLPLPKKNGNYSSLLPPGIPLTTFSLPSTPPKPQEPKGQCGCCGSNIYTGVQECELCGKKICQDCTLVITKIMHNLGWGSSTLMHVPGSTLPFQGSNTSNTSNPKDIPRDIVICTSCADLLKLSLRIASTQGYDIEKEKQE